MVEAIGLTKRYGEKLALDNVSFSINRGQVVGLLGLNGAGKTTTMNILTGYISATSGAVSIDGRDASSHRGYARKITGYLPEQPAFYPEMRVNEHLSFICDLKGVTKNKTEREKHISEICDRVGISEIKGRMIRNLSKGYRQRVGFAQALLGNPRVIILDEPTAGLDPSQVIEIRKLISDSGNESAVIVSSHILSEIQTVCDRVIVLNKGRVIADGTPESLAGKMRPKNKLKVRVKGEVSEALEALKAAEGVQSVTILSQQEPDAYDYTLSGAEGSDLRPGVFYALAKAGLPLLDTYGAGVSLEDAFLGLLDEEAASAAQDTEGKRI